MDIGRIEFERSPLVRGGVGESRAGAATCLGSVELVTSAGEGTF